MESPGGLQNEQALQNKPEHALGRRPSRKTSRRICASEVRARHELQRKSEAQCSAACCLHCPALGPQGGMNPHGPIKKRKQARKWAKKPPKDKLSPGRAKSRRKALSGTTTVSIRISSSHARFERRLQNDKASTIFRGACGMQRRAR